MNVTNWSQATDFGSLLSQANNNSPFWLAMTWLVTLVALVSTTVFGIEVAVITGSFVGFIMAFLLAYMGLVAWKWALMLLAILIGMLFYIIVWGKSFD